MGRGKITPKGASKKESGTHIKHAPIIRNLSKLDLETTYFVKSSSPFMSAFKKVYKILNKFDKVDDASNYKYRNGHYKNLKYITLKGMGKSMEKTLNLALKFRDELGYKTDILTGSSEVIDEFKKDINDRYSIEVDDDEMEEEEEILYKKRMVSSIEIRLWLKR